MARDVARGDIWRMQLSRPDKRRPVLVLSRPALIAALHTVTVAAITSTLRDSPTEVELGVDHGLKGRSCVNLANLFTVPKAQLRGFVGSVDKTRMRAVCRALAIATDCDDGQ